jgi:hypothetical protein
LVPPVKPPLGQHVTPAAAGPTQSPVQHMPDEQQN